MKRVQDAGGLSMASTFSGERPSPMREHFRFGVATADHQCEAYDGRDDIRDVWERVRGLVPRGRATDFWNRYREDVDLAKVGLPRRR